jgi:hypothetical protein
MINTGNALQVHAPKTKIFAGRTNLSECVLEALFKGVSTVFGLRNVESASKPCGEHKLRDFKIPDLRIMIEHT